MNLGTLAQRAGKVAAKNSPAILTAIGVTGTLTTAYLAAKAAFKSVDVLKEAELKKEASVSTEEASTDEGTFGLTRQEKFEAVWKLYVPAAASAAMTVSAIILANRIGERRNAALASAYSVVQEGYKEYRAKATEKVGKKKEQEIRDEIAQERIDRNPINHTTLIVNDAGSTLCYDRWNDRYFTSSKNAIDKAVNEFNALVLADGYASLNELFHFLGIDMTLSGEEIGYNTDRLLEIDVNAVVTKDGEPALTWDYRVPPITRFDSVH
jgi:Family of unknown function (DUF6353)